MIIRTPNLIHIAKLIAARCLAHLKAIPQQGRAPNMLNKLARTFATRVEALKKYHSTSERNVTVRDVTVNDGGQAIAPTVQTEDVRPRNSGEQPFEPETTTSASPANAAGPALLGHEQALAAWGRHAEGRQAPG